MGQNVTERLTDAVRAFNARAYQAKEKGLPFVIETAASSERGSGGGDHVCILRAIPVSAHVLPEARDRQCAAEIALFSAAGEVNRLVDEARKRKLTLEIKLQVSGEPSRGEQISLVLYGLS